MLGWNHQIRSWELHCHSIILWGWLDMCYRQSADSCQFKRCYKWTSSLTHFALDISTACFSSIVPYRKLRTSCRCFEYPFSSPAQPLWLVASFLGGPDTSTHPLYLGPRGLAHSHHSCSCSPLSGSLCNCHIGCCGVRSELNAFSSIEAYQFSSCHLLPSMGRN